MRVFFQKQICLKDSCITKTHPCTDESSQKLGTCHVLHSLKAAQQVENVLFKGLSWSKPLPSSLAGFCFFQAAVWSQRFLCGLSCLRGTPSSLNGGDDGGGNESSQIQEFPEATWSCLSSVLKSFLTGWTVSIS